MPTQEELNNTMNRVPTRHELKYCYMYCVHANIGIVGHLYSQYLIKAEICP